MRAFAALLIAAFLMACSSDAPKADSAVAREDLRGELLRMKDEDQAIRLARPIDIEKMKGIDRRNTARLKEIVAEVGWPTPAIVGSDGAHAAWLLVQHADLDKPFQVRALELMEPLLPQGNARRTDYAYLWDRTHQPQRYGTQGRCNAEHRFEPRETEDPANVDQRRKDMDLPPLQEYLDFATKHLCVK